MAMTVPALPFRRRRARRAATAVLTAACLAAAAAPTAHADEASAALAKYEQPVGKAIDRALAYLAKNQRQDGGIHVRGQSITAVTSLSVMAFLAKGYTPGAGPYGRVINRGIDRVLANQQVNGLLVEASNSRGAMYSHAISTLMLSEVSGMVDPARQKRIDRALAKALMLILAAQGVRKSANHAGGWRYQHTSTDSDISCTGWAIMSLRSARNNGASVPKESVGRGVEFILRCRAPDGGFCYQPGGQPGLARTGTALLCLGRCGHHRSQVAIKAGDWILASIGKGRTDAARFRAQWDQQNQRYSQTVAAAKKRIGDSKRRGDPAERTASYVRRHAQLLQRRADLGRRRAGLLMQRATRLRFGGSHFYYGLYYSSQGMFQLGGRHW
jgi:hypothetical protein